MRKTNLEEGVEKITHGDGNTFYYPYYLIDGEKHYVSSQDRVVRFEDKEDAKEYLENNI